MKRPSIAELIACPKTISKAVQANDDDPKHHRLDLVLKSEAPGKFQSFIRVKRAMKEHFSIGLRYLDDEGAHVVLLRVNGDHGRHRNPDGGLILSGPHVHGFRGPLRELPPQDRVEARWAWPLPADHLALPVAWRTFCSLVHLESERKYDRKVAELYTSWRQLSFKAFL